MSPSVSEVQGMFPRCPLCGMNTSLFLDLVVIRVHASHRVAHETCAKRNRLTAVEAA